MHEVPLENCLAYCGTLMMMNVMMKVMSVSGYYSLTTHDPSRVMKQRIRKFLTSGGKDNGSLSWVTQYLFIESPLYAKYCSRSLRCDEERKNIGLLQNASYLLQKLPISSEIAPISVTLTEISSNDHMSGCFH